MPGELSYKLTYFDGKGRGEVARLLLTAAGKSFTDKRVSTTTNEWTELKPKTPQGTLPMLEVDDGNKTITISQSMSINRYLARTLGYYGQTEYEMTVVDEILDTCVDMFNPMVAIFFNPNEDEKAEQLTSYMQDKIPVFLSVLEELIKETGNDGYSVGSSLSVADLVLMTYIDNCRASDYIANFPRLVQNRKTTMADDKIRDYLTNRPQTRF